MNNYQQIKVLGEGGFGKAILVRQRSTGDMCVIKEVRLTALSQRDRNEATREAKVLASLKHPNIVNYITSFQERGCFYIVMEYCDGGDLAKKIAGRGSVLFSEDEILHYFIQVSLAIKYIHDRKILHRDLKAQNIFLSKDGTAKLGDFGIARVLEHTFQLCRTQIGTPYYLSPEICEGKNYNSKTDIWSLGCILYELCTLKRAFEGCDQRGILMKIVRGKYAPISSKYSHDLRNLVDLMLTKEASKRPTINEILKLPFIQNRLSSMLEKTILDYEFSHTIIHGRKPFAAPTVVISKSSSENNNQNYHYKDDQNQLKNPPSNPPPQHKNDDKNRPTSEQRLIDQNFLKEQQQKKQQQQQQIQQQQQRQPIQRQPPKYPANVDPRYARRNYDIYGNQRNPKQTEEQERERQRQIEDLKRRHQQDENERKAREQKQQQFQQQLEQEREKRSKQREIEEYKRISAEREKQKNRLEQQKKELEEMKRLAAEQNRIEEEKRRASMEELRRQEEDFRRRREEAKRIMRNHEKEEEKKQAEEFERKRLEEVERKRKEVEEMVKRRQAEADELKRIQEQKRKERLIEQQREREKLELDRLRIAEEEKARRRAVMQKQRELRELQKKDQEDKRKRQLNDLHQNALIANNRKQSNQQKNQTFIDNNNNVDIRNGYSYNDPSDPLEQTTADMFISKISQDGPAWAKMPQKRIPISLDQTIRVTDDDDDNENDINDDDDEFASVQKNEFFDSIRSGAIKSINKQTSPSWAKNNNNNDEEKQDNFINDTLGFTFIDSVPSWAQNQQNKNQQQNDDDLPDNKLKKQSSCPSSRLLPDRITKQSSNHLDDDDVDKEVDLQMNKKFMEEDDNKLSSLHDLAMSIKQALEIPDEKEKDETEASKNDEQIFFYDDEQVKLPVANDKNSLAKRQDAIRNFLEEKIGVETFIALNDELINKEADDNAPTPIISNLPPGIVCLAQQWLMLDATAKDQN